MPEAFHCQATAQSPKIDETINETIRPRNALLNRARARGLPFEHQTFALTFKTLRAAPA
jgi:hypothetical protein